MTIIDQWYESGKPATIAGHTVRLRSHPILDMPLVVTRGQGSTYWLDSDEGSLILKDFLPAQRPQRQYIEAAGGCIPRLPAFRSGWERRVLSSADLTATEGMFAPQAFGSWLDGTILMPLLRGNAWSDFLTDIASDRRNLLIGERLAIAWQVAEASLMLELMDVSHRDLSATNILIEPVSRTLSLIDWDTVHHPTLPFQVNTTVGTPGYVAPWIGADGTQSWSLHADRFAVAVCITEILTIQSGTPLVGDGSLFEQEAIGKATAAFEQAHSRLNEISLSLAALFKTAWHASSFEHCPSPVVWLHALTAAIKTENAADAQDRHNQVIRFASWDAVVRQLKDTLHDGDAVDIHQLISSRNGLEQLLTPGQHLLFAQYQARGKALSSLRSLLTKGTDEEILQAATVPGFDLARLRESESLQIEQAAARIHAVTSLRDVIETTPENSDKVVKAWWQAVRMGCQIPPALAEIAQAAQARRLGTFTSVSASAILQQSSITKGKLAVPARIETPSDLDSEQARTGATLENAIAHGTAQDICAAAAALRQAGGEVPDNAWDAVLTAQDRVSVLISFQEALSGGATEELALSWARINTLWPEDLTVDHATTGITAFRRWGREARLESIDEMCGSYES